jgi:hypothetical protein
MTGPAADTDPRLAWINKVKRMHRNKRYLGYIGCAFGVAMILAARFQPEAVPDWMFMAGVAVIGVSWLMFVFVLIAKWLWVKKNPYKA